MENGMLTYLMPNNCQTDHELPSTWCILYHVYYQLIDTGMYHGKPARWRALYRFSDYTSIDMHYWCPHVSVKLKNNDPIWCRPIGDSTWMTQTTFLVSISRYGSIKSPTIHLIRHFHESCLKCTAIRHSWMEQNSVARKTTRCGCRSPEVFLVLTSSQAGQSQEFRPYCRQFNIHFNRKYL